MNTCVVTNEGLRANLGNEQLISHCHDLLLKDFYIYRATDKLLDVFENEISFYESSHLELSNAVFVYELLCVGFNNDKEVDLLKVAYEDSVNDLAMHLAKSYRHSTSIEKATNKLLKLLINSFSIKEMDERVQFYIENFKTNFSDINILNFKDIEKRLDLKGAKCL